MPAISTVMLWVLNGDHQEFSEQYARARASQAEIMFEEILDISDDGSNDYMIITKGDEDYNVENREVTNRSKLRVDTRKWYLSKVLPKKFGDKRDLTSDGKAPPKPMEAIQTQTKQFSFSDTTATRRVFALRKRIRAVAGGTSASKTISILIWLIDYCQSHSGKTASVVSESYPHLERGAMLDFENIMKDRGYWNDDRWNQTKHTYTFETGSRLEFSSPDTYGKAHGPRRDVLFINEANDLDYRIADQLIVRTRAIVLMDWNPTTEFWFYTQMLPFRRDDIDLATLTYV